MRKIPSLFKRTFADHIVTEISEEVTPGFYLEMMWEMLFLIDYENVQNDGMRGCELLEPDDGLALFYSSSAKNMEQAYLDAIEDSGCRFDAIRLIKAGKNALDFYIASYLGKCFGEGVRDRAVIVSKDGGFSAVRDYWVKCAPEGRQVYLAPSVEKGILSAGGSVRAKELARRKALVDISEYYAAYQERENLRNTISDAFAQTEYREKTSDIYRLVKNSRGARVLYLDSLKCFGRKEGLNVYRQLKKIKLANQRG